MTLAPGSPRPRPSRDPGSPSVGTVVALILVAWVGALVLRLATPSDLLDADQERPAAYVLDALRNGHWVVQRDSAGEISSKPPLYTWLAAAATSFGPRITLFTLYLPSALAVLGVALLLASWGGRIMGRRVGLLAALTWIISTVGLKHVCLARTDALFGLTVFATLLLAFRTTLTGRGTAALWLSATASVLTKGPLGLLLAGGGIGTAVRRLARRSRPTLRPLLYGRGWLALLLVTGAWFGLACWAEGREVTDKMLGRELIGHALADGRGRPPLAAPYKPLLYLLSRFLPWSPFAVAGAWRVFRRPAPRPLERRFERLLVAYLLFGLVVFAIAPHRRADHLVPLVPAAALLASRELASLLRRSGARAFGAFAGAVVALGLALGLVWYSGPRARQDVVQRTLAVAAAAAEIESRLGYAAPLEHAGTPFALQFGLDTMRQSLTAEQALAHLRGGSTRVAVSGKVLRELTGGLGREGMELVLSIPPAGVHIVQSPGFEPPPAPRAPEPRPLRAALGLALLALVVGAMARAAARGIGRG